MTALSVNVDRKVTGGTFQRLRAELSANPYQGSLLSYEDDGYVHELVAGEEFAGICRQQIRTADAGAADGDVAIEATTGIFSFWATVSGITLSDVDVATKVYASDDNTLTTSSTGNTLVGVVEDYDGSLTKIRAATYHVSGALPS